MSDSDGFESEGFDDDAESLPVSLSALSTDRKCALVTEQIADSALDVPPRPGQGKHAALLSYDLESLGSFSARSVDDGSKLPSKYDGLVSCDLLSEGQHPARQYELNPFEGLLSSRLRPSGQLRGVGMVMLPHQQFHCLEAAGALDIRKHVSDARREIFENPYQPAGQDIWMPNTCVDPDHPMSEELDRLTSQQRVEQFSSTVQGETTTCLTGMPKLRKLCDVHLLHSGSLEELDPAVSFDLAGGVALTRFLQPVPPWLRRSSSLDANDDTMSYDLAGIKRRAPRNGRGAKGKTRGKGGATCGPAAESRAHTARPRRTPRWFCTCGDGSGFGP